MSYLSNKSGSASGGLIYQGLWDANTNTPTLTSGVGTIGEYYVVSVAGTTNLDGITDWGVNDWAIFNGVEWQKIDNSENIGWSTTGNAGTVAGTNFIGTTDAVDFVVKTDNNETARFKVNRAKQMGDGDVASGLAAFTTGTATLATSENSSAGGANTKSILGNSKSWGQESTAGKSLALYDNGGFIYDATLGELYLTDDQSGIVGTELVYYSYADLAYYKATVATAAFTTFTTVTFVSPIGATSESPNALSFVSTVNDEYFNTTAFGDRSFSGGLNSTAFGSISRAIGKDSTAFGSETTASEQTSTAFGSKTTASGESSTAFGAAAQASGQASTAFGTKTNASGNNSTAFGFETDATGTGSTSFGNRSLASGNYSFATGANTEAKGVYSSASGQDTKADGVLSSASGSNTYAAATISSSAGISTGATAGCARSYGDTTVAGMSIPLYDNGGKFYDVALEEMYVDGDQSSLVGNKIFYYSGTESALYKNLEILTATYTTFTTFTFTTSFAGADDIANRNSFVSLVTDDITNPTSSGNRTFAGSDNSTAIGFNTKAFGSSSLAAGIGNHAMTEGETAIGTYGTDYVPALDKNDRVFNVGNGTSDAKLSDAFTVLKNGKAGIDMDNFETTTSGAKLQVNGYIAQTFQRIDVTTTFDAETMPRFLNVDNSSTAIVVTIPEAATVVTDGITDQKIVSEFTITLDGSNLSNLVTIIPADPGGTINGAATYNLTGGAPYQSITIYPDGSNWFIS